MSSSRVSSDTVAVASAVVCPHLLSRCQGTDARAQMPGLFGRARQSERSDSRNSPGENMLHLYSGGKVRASSNLGSVMTDPFFTKISDKTAI